MAVASARFTAVPLRAESNVARNGAHLSMVAPSVTPASVSCSFSGLTLARRAGANRSSIVARAADLEFESSPAAEEPSVVPQEESTPPPASPEEGTKLYVGNIPWSYDSKQLAEVFQDVGDVELVEVIYDRITSQSRGFAFVTMATREEAALAIEKLDGTEIGGRAMKVNFPQSNKEPRTGMRSERPPRNDGDFASNRYNNPNKLFVGNLAWGVDDVTLAQLFSDFGNVVEAKVVYDRDSGRSRGFGFVTYGKSEEVTEAIQNLDGAEFDGRQLRVNLAGDKPPPRNTSSY